MAINKKLIHFRTKAAFTTELNAGNIPDTSIVFIKDTKEIWTHGQLYSCFPLPDAADGVTGGIQIGYAASGRNYALELLNKKAYVNVPWTDQNVYQASPKSDTTIAFPILGSPVKLTAGNAGEAGPSVQLQGLTFTPNGNVLSVGTGEMVAAKFTGALNGNAKTATSATSATKATQDGSGNNIVDTYQTKAGFNSFKNEFKELTNAEIDNLWATAPDELS